MPTSRKMTKPAMMGYGEDGVPVAGKPMVARVLRSRSPLRRVTSAFHGPSGSRLSSMIAIGSVAPIARLVPVPAPRARTG